ncbi:MAG: alpha/beta fold hydrolase [Acidimicrobiia bacterium]
MATLEANGVPHHFEEVGTGPPVMLLHGGLESSASWELQTPAIAQGHRVVLVDRRAHGRTPDVGPITYELMRDDTIACIEALDLGGTHLVGWSDGGIVALLVAIARPDLVGRIVTLGANANADAYTPQARTALGPESPLLPMIRDDYAAVSPDGADHWPVMLEKMMRLWWQDPLDFTAELDRIAAPTLILAGDDDCIDPLHSVEMFRRIPNARLGIVPGASHVAPVEQPDLVNRMILDFLDGPERPAELMPLLPARM